MLMGTSLFYARVTTPPPLPGRQALLFIAMLCAKAGDYAGPHGPHYPWPLTPHRHPLTNPASQEVRKKMVLFNGKWRYSSLEAPPWQRRCRIDTHSSVVPQEGCRLEKASWHPSIVISVVWIRKTKRQIKILVQRVTGSVLLTVKGTWWIYSWYHCWNPEGVAIEKLFYTSSVCVHVYGHHKYMQL